MREIYELNEKFFELYARVNEYSPDMTKRQTDAMTSRLLKQYEVEFKKLELEKSIRDKSRFYRLKTEKGYFVPKITFFFFRNKLAKLISKEIKETAEDYFKNYFENRLRLMTGAEEPESEEPTNEELEETETVQTEDGEPESQEPTNEEPGESAEIPLSET